MKKCHYFYISGMTEDERGGIFRCRWENAPEVVDFTPLERTNFSLWSRDRKTLYATMQHNGIGGVAAYRVGDDGSLTLLNMLPAEGKSVCYLELSRDGKFLYSANYSSGNFSEFLLEADGSIAKLNRVIYHCGKGIRAEQDSPHPHCCIFTPDGKYLCVADLGTDRIVLYPASSGDGTIQDACGEYLLPAGSGPRHLIFDASGKTAYLLCELGNILCSLHYSDGKFTALENCSTLPPAGGRSSAAAIRFSADGRFLFASNRGDDSVAAFELDGKGKISLCGFYPAYGRSPRDFNFLPGVEIAAFANEFSDEVIFCRCDQNSGKIFERCGSLILPRPLYVLV